MRTRLLVGLPLAPLVVWLVLDGPGWGVATLFIAAAAVCLWELMSMWSGTRAVERVAVVGLGVALLVVATVAQTQRVSYSVVLTIAFLLPPLLVIMRPRPTEQAALRLFLAWGALAYIVVPFTFGLAMALHDPRDIIMVLTTVWMGDTAAYFVGKAIGRRKLHPHVSPNKTVEGAIGGLLASALGAYLVATLLMRGAVGGMEAAWIGLFGGAVAQCGDLAESLLKRSFGVKDSGKILPGHGGMLDRVDGVLFAFPIFALCLGY